MKLIIFFILIINFNNLNAAEMWDFSNLKSNNIEHTALVDTLLESLNKLETTGANDTLSDISSKIGNLDNTAKIQAKGNFYKSTIIQVKKKIFTLDLLKTQYLNELKTKCTLFTKPVEPKKEKLLKKPKESTLEKKSPWDLTQITITPKLEELKSLLSSFCTDSNGLSSTISINDQIKNIQKLLTDLNITYNNSTEFDNHKTNNDLQKYKSFKQKYIALQKELERLSLDKNSVSEDEPSSNTDEKYLSCEDNYSSENEDSPSNKKNTINDCTSPESKKLSALATIASIENSLTRDQLVALKLNNQAQTEQNKLLLLTLKDHLDTLNEVVLALLKDWKESDLQKIKIKIEKMLKDISNSAALEKETLDQTIHFTIVPYIKNTILLPLKKLCEQLPSVPASINNPSNQAIDSKTITNTTTNNKPESNITTNPTPLSQQMVNDLLQNLPKPDTFPDLNNDKNRLNKKNPTSIPKNKDSKTNKRTWSKPKIIFGIALFSITLYWFLKNYLFSKNPA